MMTRRLDRITNPLSGARWPAHLDNSAALVGCERVECIAPDDWSPARRSSERVADVLQGARATCLGEQGGNSNREFSLSVRWSSGSFGRSSECCWRASAVIVDHHQLGGNVIMAKAPATATGYCMKCKTP